MKICIMLIIHLIEELEGIEVELDNKSIILLKEEWEVALEVEVDFKKIIHLIEVQEGIEVELDNKSIILLKEEWEVVLYVEVDFKKIILMKEKW